MTDLNLTEAIQLLMREFHLSRSKAITMATRIMPLIVRELRERMAADIEALEPIDSDDDAWLAGYHQAQRDTAELARQGAV